MKVSSYRTVLGLVYLVLFLLLTLGLSLSCFGEHTHAALQDGEALSSCEAFFCRLNRSSFYFLRKSPFWYRLSEILGVVCLCIPLGFFGLGCVQLFRRKSLKKVDADLLLMGGLYVLTGACYLLFEFLAVNFRPVLEGGEIEASYPSSHVVLVYVIATSASFFLQRRVRSSQGKAWLSSAGALISLLAVVGRLLAGVHWLTDILGGVLLGGCLILFYKAAVSFADEKKVGIYEK